MALHSTVLARRRRRRRPVGGVVAVMINLVFNRLRKPAAYRVGKEGWGDDTLTNMLFFYSGVVVVYIFFSSGEMRSLDPNSIELVLQRVKRQLTRRHQERPNGFGNGSATVQGYMPPYVWVYESNDNTKVARYNNLQFILRKLGKGEGAQQQPFKQNSSSRLLLQHGRLERCLVDGTDR